MSIPGSLYGSDRGLLAVEVHSRRVRIAYYEPASGRSGEKRILAETEIAVDEPAAAAAAIRTLLTKHRIRCRRAALSIPRYQAMLRFLTLPASQPSEIAAMARMEMIRQSPYSEDELILSHKKIRQKEDGHSEVLLVSILRSAVDRNVLLLRAAGLIVERAFLGAEAVSSWFSREFPEAGTQNALVIDCAGEHMEIAMLESGSWVFSRGVLLESLPKNSAAWLAEITASVAAYHKTAHTELQAVLFYGPADRSAALQQWSAEHKLAYQRAQLSIPALAPAPDPDGYDGAYLGLIQFLRDPEGLSVDLLPADLLNGGRSELLKQNIVPVLIGITLFTLFAAAGIWKKADNDRRLLERIDAEIKQELPKVREAERIAEALGVTKSRWAGAPMAVDLFIEVYRAVPSGMTLEMLDYDQTSGMTLRGHAPAAASVFDLIRALEASDLFSRAQVRYVNKRTAGNAETVDFEVIARPAGQRGT